MLGEARRGWLPQRCNSETLTAFEPPRQQQPAAACPSLSKERSAIFIFGGEAPRHARLLRKSRCKGRKKRLVPLVTDKAESQFPVLYVALRKMARCLKQSSFSE